MTILKKLILICALSGIFVFVPGVVQSLPISLKLSHIYQGENDEAHSIINLKSDSFITLDNNYSSYFGGLENELTKQMIVDSKNNIIISGLTESFALPVNNSFQPVYKGNGDIFILKFSPDGQIIFSTFLGGSGFDEINNLGVDIFGNIYLSGVTYSSDFPVINAYQNTYNGNGDGFITKISPNGKNLLFSSYFGGSGADMLTKMFVYELGNIYLSGFTLSSDFPVLNQFQNYNGQEDVFVAHFLNNGQLFFSTYLGGLGTDLVRDIYLNSGSIYLAGWTNSGNFPIESQLFSFNSINTNGQGFIAAFDSTGFLFFSTYFGGSGTELINKIVLDSIGNIYFSGITDSTDIPIKNAYQNKNNGSTDAFLVKLSLYANDFLFSTYLGGSFEEQLTDLTLDNNGNVYLLGKTNSDNFPLANAYQSARVGSDDAFISKFSFDGQNLLYSTYLGGSNNDELTDFVTDDLGNLYICGKTFSDDFPLSNEIDSNFQGTSEIVVLKIYPDFQTLYFSTFYGGSKEDNLTKMILDPSGNIFLTGFTSSSDFPVVEPNQSSNGGKFDAFFAHLKSAQDGDGDGFPDDWERQVGFDTTKNERSLDNDEDGIPNYWEYEMELNPNVPDANGDNDEDGMPNYWEYTMGLNANYNDAYNDKDNDTMQNLWEYKMGLNASFNDAYDDKDFDLVSNVFEYQAGTNANDFWSFPLILPYFPFIISFPHILLYLNIGFFCIFGGLSAIILRNRRRNALMKRLGVPNVQTLVLMSKGKFRDYETLLKAQELHISTQEEYDFTIEIKDQLEN